MLLTSPLRHKLFHYWIGQRLPAMAVMKLFAPLFIALCGTLIRLTNQKISTISSEITGNTNRYLLSDSNNSTFAGRVLLFKFFVEWNSRCRNLLQLEAWCGSLMFLSGDISINPGPALSAVSMDYPMCVLCKRTITWSHLHASLPTAQSRWPPLMEVLLLLFGPVHCAVVQITSPYYPITVQM